MHSMLRITGGRWNGRILKAPHAGKGEGTRPTQARLRQALFNSIQFRIDGARVLDLFAGSGALGFEALSRGAAHVTFVEGAQSAIKCIEANRAGLANELEPGAAHVAPMSLSPPLPSARGLAGQLERLAESGAFDLILIDPPYADGWELPLLEYAPWEKLLTPGGLICFEWGAKKSKARELPDKVGVLVKVREKIYGDSVLTTFERESS